MRLSKFLLFDVSRMAIVECTAWMILLILAPAKAECDAKTCQHEYNLRFIDNASTDGYSTSATAAIHDGNNATGFARAVGKTIRHQSPPGRTVQLNTAAALSVGDSDTRKKYDKESSKVHSRERRTLTFPSPATILVTFGLGTPLQLDRESVILGAFAKFIYTLPSNSTDFTEPGIYISRTKSRWSIYKVLERAAELYGFGTGKGCLLRAICEVAAVPFDLHHGLFSQMVQAFLSPSSTSEPYDEYTDREYHAAESLGKHVGDSCHALYPECERSVLDVFSTTVTMLEDPAISTTTPTTRPGA